ncbi:MAG TPA: DEAD/DEAH box helicase [Bacteroidales bacterium]|nr:DEAD/DEAH box helicase [Bacteroidales bacterium]
MERPSEKKNKTFALILTNHRIWGQILLPYILVNEYNRSYFRLSECLFPFPGIDTLGTLTAEERELVKIINEYSERTLFKLFSRERNVKEFQSKVTPERLEKFIRPYIEKRIYKSLEISKDEDIPVYFQKTKTGTLHAEDRLTLSSDNAIPVFRFVREAEFSTYNLSLEAAGKSIDLRSNPVDIICMSPCLIRESSRLFFVTEVDGPKLKPFILKDFITIPKKTEDKYFSSFVANAVNNFKVEGSGFEITEPGAEKEAVIEISNGMRDIPVMILKYSYQGHLLYANEPSSSFTVFEKQGDNFIFKKYKRDFDWEKRCRDILGELGYFSDDDISFFPVYADSVKKVELYSLIENINTNYSEITESGFRLISRLDHNYNLRPVHIEVSSQLENDWFDIKAIVKIGEWNLPFNLFRKNILAGIREYRLPDDTIVILPETWFTRYKNIFEFGQGTDNKLKIHKQHFALLRETLSDDKNTGFEKLDKLLKPEQIPLLEAPSGLKVTMRHYQADGLNWLSFLQNARLGGCLADDMGLGKTIQALAMLQHNKETMVPVMNNNITEQPTLFNAYEQKMTSLIIVPASLVYNWENEIQRFVPGMSVYSYKGNQRKKSTDYFHNFDIILSSYHTIRQDIDLINTYHFHYIILDESQVIKNPASMLYKTVIRLKSDFKLVLTGTPVENSLTDLWTQLNFVNPGLLGDLAFFHREFAKPIEKMGDDKKEDKLRKIIQPFILRRTKEMVARDLPPVTEQTVFCDMTDEQYRIYDEEKSSVRNSILNNIAANGAEKSTIVVLQGLMKLRQISNHPVLAYEDYDSGSGKFEAVVQDIESVISEGHKILVFSSFVKHLDLYADIFRKKRITFSMLTGASTNRERIVNSFQTEANNRIFLISLKAGGVGLNLTAAEYVFILDPWWNPASEMQALNRAHRIGQDKSVFVYRYITSNSIEEKIVRLQEKKSKLADTFITSNNPLKDIDIKEILNIIG